MALAVLGREYRSDGLWLQRLWPLFVELLDISLLALLD